MTRELRKGDYVISTDPARLDVQSIFEFLSEAYWSKGLAFERMERSLRNSMCVGLYHRDRQIGFARVVTDYARFAYLADVFVIDAYRGQGLSTWLLEVILGFEELQGVKWLLSTRDAHGLYERFGFRRLSDPKRLMERAPSENR